MCVRFILILFLVFNISSQAFAQERYIPNDPLFPHQWWADNTGQIYYKHLTADFGLFTKGIPDIDIDLPEAWAIEKGSPDCLIAILDEGFQLDQPDLKNKFSNKGWNFIRNDSILISGGNHGTSVAGIVAGEIDNNLGIAGIAPGCKILPIVITTSSTMYKKNDVKNPLVDGIKYAIKNKATVISISVIVPSVEEVIEKLKREYFEDADIPEEELAELRLVLTETLATMLQGLEAAVNEAYEANIPVVAGAGNEPTTSKNYPAAFENVIAVTAVNNRGEPTSFANRGEWVNLAAPGESILTCSTTFSEQLLVKCPIEGACFNHQDFCHPDGTSFSTPMVAGVIGLLKSHFPEITIEEIKETLIKTAKPNKIDPKFPPIVSAGNALRNPVFK